MSPFDRRDFLKILGSSAAAATFPGSMAIAGEKVADLPDDYYDVPMQGSARIIHATDVHAQLYPMYFREPNVNLGIGKAFGRPPHLVGKKFLEHMGIAPNTPEAYAYTYLDFDEGAERYGRLGGFPQIATLYKRLRQQAGGVENTITMDGGDLWQGSATALWTRGADTVDASNLLGVDIMVGHWEFTYKEEEVLANVVRFKGEFLGQNVHVKEESLFEDAYAEMVEKYDNRGLYNEDTGRAFRPYTVKEVGGARIAVIGQAFPRTANANPQEFFPDWSFGLREDDMIALAEQIQADEKPDAMVLLSHNGMDVDLKMAERIPGLNVVFGGHTHDGMPKPVEVKNASGGTCLVTNAGSHGKFVSVMDFDFGDGKLKGLHYRMLPVFERALEPDPEVVAFLTRLRETKYDENIVESRRKEYFFNPARVGKSYGEILDEKLAIAGTTLYRRGNFEGTWDQVLCDALLDEYKADISLSAGVRWGTTVPKGHWITMGDLMTQCAITYGETYVRDMKGSVLLEILEGIADNLFAEDPYLQSGGDMVRIGGLEYAIEPGAKLGKRLSGLRLANGEPFDPEKTYRVAGWASVGAAPEGRLMWDVVRDYILRTRDENKVLHVRKLNTPRLIGVKDNPGIADYAGEVA